MKYLNLGCGFHYSTLPEWKNLDFVSRGADVIGHNLMNGIPFEDESFDLVYHSHVLEHFSKDDGENFIAECLRVLKPKGIIRIAVPDLEKISRNYLKFLEQGIFDPGNKSARLNYEWTLLEMFDQTVRSFSGGNMAKYLFQDSIKNEDFVFQRLGDEAISLRDKYLVERKQKELNGISKVIKSKKVSFNNRIKQNLKRYLYKKLNISEEASNLGKFRLSGEIHQWMYDRYSLSNLLKDNNMHNIVVRDAFTSYITNWSDYNIDGKNSITRKPDSLFLEAMK